MTNYGEVKKFLYEVPTDIAGRIKEEFFGWPKGTKVSDIEKWFDKKARGEKMKYYTMFLAHSALLNEFNMTQKQLAAVNKKLKEANETDKAYLTDVFGDPVQRVEYENFQKKLMNLRAIEMELSQKAEDLADAIADFDKHNW